MQRFVLSLQIYGPRFRAGAQSPVAKRKGFSAPAQRQRSNLTSWSYALLEKPPLGAATQHSPSILWKPKVYYRLHNSPQFTPILSQINPVHAISYFSMLHFNRPTLWSIGQCSWLKIQRSGFDSWLYQIF
jgi:hypothetical protein